MLQTLEPGVVKPKPLFPGQSCYPLSEHVARPDAQKLRGEFKNKTHQLLKIFEIIGSPTA